MKVRHFFVLASLLAVCWSPNTKAIAAQPYPFKGKLTFKNLTGAAFDLVVVAKDSTDATQFFLATTIPYKGIFRATGLPQNGTCSVTYDFNRDGVVDGSESFNLYTSEKRVIYP